MDFSCSSQRSRRCESVGLRTVHYGVVDVPVGLSILTSDMTLSAAETQQSVGNQLTPLDLSLFVYKQLEHSFDVPE